jgi:lipopolysaccharide transport system ATP-binding protein
MAVKVEHLWKTFQIPHERRTTLFENLVGMMMPRQYETFTVLKDVSFEVDEGEFVGIIGDNGSGKSTLLKIIANILRPTKGTVKVDGRITPFLELGVGFQPDLTVKENIGVYAAVMGLSRREIKERSDEVIEFAGLENFEDTKLKNLSSGMQVRLAFSTAIQTKPDVLLVDEVLAVGDMEFQQKCFDVFNRYRKEGVTILLVSHDLSAVRRLCDRTLLLGGGEQRAYGGTEEILDRYIYKIEEDSKDRKKAEQKETKPTELTSWGDKNVSIIDVRFIDKFGGESNQFSSLDPMTIRIYYRAPAMVQDPVFGIALYSEQNQFLYGTNTEIKNITIDHVVGEGYIDLKIEKLPLLYGRFLLTVAVHDRERQFCDWIDKRYSFEVLPKGKDGGIFEVPCKWIASPGDVSSGYK